VLLALLVLLIILCVVAVKLITTVEELNKVLDDTSVVSEVAANTATQVDGIVADVGSAANQLKVRATDGSVVGTVTSVARAVNSVAGYGKGNSRKGARQRRK
jgi:hypothetical protein